MQTLFTGTIAKVSSLIAIVIGGYSFAHPARRRPWPESRQASTWTQLFILNSSTHDSHTSLSRGLLKTSEQIDHRHYVPIQNALRDESAGYDWKRETGDIQSCQHRDHLGWLHIDPHGTFYDRQANPVSRDMALENAGHVSSPGISNDANARSVSTTNDQGFSL